MILFQDTYMQVLDYIIKNDWNVMFPIIFNLYIRVFTVVSVWRRWTAWHAAQP
jgi:hypothetical protein